jgi:thiol-disulfide isomerase/thioredoxin
MKGWIRTLIAGLLVVVAVPVIAHQTTGKDANSQEVAQSKVSTPFPGGTAPDFALADYQGQVHKLSDYRGKPVLLNFWASWCGPCQSEMPDLAGAAKTFDGKVQFVGVNLAENDSQAVSKALLQKYSVTYPNLLDAKGEVADRYKVMVIPTSLLLDGGGKIIARFQGPITGAQIAEWLRKIS